MREPNLQISRPNKIENETEISEIAKRIKPQY